MIVSHEHKLVLVQVPHTASTDFGELLVRDYGGVSILSKHSYLDELRVFYPDLYKNYFIIGGVRNPLTERVSAYHKLVSNHVGLYGGDPNSNAIRRARGAGQLRRRRIIDEGLSFSEYFLQNVRWVYFSPIYIRRARYDYIYRIECLEQSWREVCELLGLNYSPVGNKNKTEGVPSELDAELTKVFDRSAQIHATKVFSCFMGQFDYQFPSDWCHGNDPSRLEIHSGLAFRRTMWALWSVQNSLKHLGR